MRCLKLKIPTEEIGQFCQRWKIRELAVFGSALREVFSPQSDVDLVVDFHEEANWGLWDHIQMQQELQKLLQRKVDLISKRALLQSPNWLRRQEILNTLHVLFPSSEPTHGAK